MFPKCQPPETRRQLPRRACMWLRTCKGLHAMGSAVSLTNGAADETEVGSLHK